MDIRLKDVFFQLLRIGLWGKGSLKLTAPLFEEDWLKIRSCAINHTVDGLIYDSFPFLQDDQLPSQSLRIKWAVRIDQIERHNSKMNEVIAAQYTAFTNMGLQPILQKGQGIASCYEVPLHRISGDIDWYFENKGYARSREILKQKQIIFRDTAGFSLDYDWKGIAIEHHKKLFDIGNPFKYNYLQNLQVKYRDKQQHLTLNGTSIKLLAPELQVFQVNAHILKHLIFFGIGLRQLCDSARLYHSVASKINNEELKKIYKDTGILDWTHLLHIILVKYLGLEQEKIPFVYPEKWNADWMMDEIWNSGNFGFHDVRYKDGKKTSVSLQPDGAYRLWASFKMYFKYAPLETFFYPIMQAYSRFVGKDKD